MPLGVIPFLLVMNKHTWESLPKDVQASVMKHGGEMMARMGGKAYTDVGEQIRAKELAGKKITIKAPTKERMEVVRERRQGDLRLVGRQDDRR